MDVPNLEACVVRVCDTEGKTHGTGFVVSDSLVVTCAHVVEMCRAGPGGQVCVVFHANGQEREAEVLPDFWQPSKGDDVAVLRLLPEGKPLPEGVEAAKLGSTRHCNGHRMQALGFPPLAGGYDVAFAAGHLRGVVPHPRKRPMLQMDAAPIRRGMSGAPVLDLDTGRVVGMVSEYLPDAPLEWATTAETLHGICPILTLQLPQAVEDYLHAVEKFCRDLPYVSLRSDVLLETVYVRQQIRSKPTAAREAREPETQRALKERTSPVSINEALKDQARIVVVGGPGAGKSTLLRHLVQQNAASDLQDGAYLPILVSLHGLAERRGDLTTCLQEQVAAELGKRLREPLPAKFLEDWAQQTGQTWLIALDGLDEIVDTNRRHKCLRELAQTAWPSQVRLLITTRPDETATWPAEFTLFDLLPFERRQVNEFARRWFRDDAQRAWDFLEAVHSARLGGLSSTPLLLTITATVFEKTRSLEVLRRSRLYDEFVNILLAEDTAPSRRMREQFCEQFGTTPGEALFRHRRRVLECLALAMQNGQNARSALSGLLRQPPFNWSDLDADEGATCVMDILAFQRSGVFARRGDTYDFIHPTFREYLAAPALVRECEQDLEQIWRRAVSRWADENWREVTLFVLGILSDAGKDVTVLIKRIRRAGKYGSYFAGAALAEQVRVEPSLSNGIIDSLLSSVRKMKRWDLRPVSILGELRGYPRAADGLLALARDEQVEAWVRVKAADALGRLGQADKAIPILLALARGENREGFVRCEASIAMGRLGRADEATHILLALVYDEQVKLWERDQATIALGRLGRADNLLALVYDGKVRPGIRWRAAEMLCVLERVDYLLKLAYDEKVEARVRWRAVETLVRLGQTDKAVPIMLVLACDERAEAMVRWQAAAALGRLGQADKAIPILLALARDEKMEAFVRLQAAEALCRLGQVYEAIFVLVALTRDEQVDASVRQYAAAALGWFADARVLPDLKRIARKDEDRYVRRAARQAIKRIRQRTGR